MLKSLNPQLTTILSELRHRLENLYASQLTDVILFGSQARGEALAESDIDVLIVLKAPFDYSQEIERTSQLVADLSLKYQTVLSRAFIEPERLEQEQSPFLRNVRREGISL
ncbi:MAG: nucleotidyltransferase domain-containing protein [Microcystaceae cyanobacterium]